MIYHLARPGEWEKGLGEIAYEPDAFAHEGFIHCCNHDQLTYVTRRYFAADVSIVVLCIVPEAVTAPIRYEDLTNVGVKFPHIYGRLNTDAVRTIWRLQRTDADEFRFPVQEF